MPSEGRELAQCNMASLTPMKLFELFLEEKDFAVKAVGKRTASSALSSDDSEVSDTTIRGSDDDASEFQLVKPRKIKNKKTRRQRVSKTDSDDTETEPISTAPINFEDPPVSPDTPQAREVTAAPPVIAGSGVVNNKTTGNRSTAFPTIKPTPPVYLRNKTKWSAVTSACDRLKIQYTRARNLTDSIKITVPTTTHFRGINNYLININIVFHTHPLEEEHKGTKDTPSTWCTDCTKDGTSVGLVLSGLNKAVNIKDIYKILKSMRPLHHHRRRPYKEEGQGCATAASSMATQTSTATQPRCVMHRPTLYKECTRTKKSEKALIRIMWQRPHQL
ncbi:hypothetical protein EVAR_36576_1 [Eumeta japonica]|uniref:Uncharacterized protein n=1 Tax=Eumeta variegata TaxID=151549 RepID=A0A4C1XM19_EUMVA|nr:hypothetical protein EVAR_36576_1 [Eumeta japonica]